MMPDKPRLAILVPGGIGTGKFNTGIPVLHTIIRLLTRHFDITVFQFHPVNPGYHADGFELQVIQNWWSLIRFGKFFFHFWKRHRVKKFSVVHGFLAWSPGTLTVIAAKFFNVKSTVSLLGSDTVSIPSIQYGQLISPFRKRVIFWTLRHAHITVSLTRYMIDRLKSQGFSGGNFKVIPWGINQVAFNFKLKPLHNPIRFLHIGNLSPIKDQRTLLLAFKLIHDKVRSVLTIIGEGPMEGKIRKWIGELGLLDSVILLPQQPYESLPSFYHDADVLLHTSLSEGQSEVVTEAMSCGVLVCGTRVGLMNDLPECCLAVEAGDYKMLAEAVLRIIPNQDQRLQTIDSANRWAVEHSIFWTTDELTKLYIELIKS